MSTAEQCRPVLTYCITLPEQTLPVCNTSRPAAIKQIEFFYHTGSGFSAAVPVYLGRLTLNCGISRTLVCAQSLNSAYFLTF